MRQTADCLDPLPANPLRFRRQCYCGEALRSPWPAGRRDGQGSNASTGEIRRHAALRAILPARVREHCKNLLLDALACAVAGHQGEETGQMAALASALAQGRESSVIGGGHLSLAGATLLNGYLVTAVTMCDVHRADHDPHHAGNRAAGAGHRRARRAFRPRSSGRHRRGLRSDDADRHRPRLSGVPRARLARARHPRPVRRRRGGRLAAWNSTPTPWRARSGLPAARPAGTFAAWGTPTVKFHQCRGALSGLMAALLGAAEFRRHARIPHRQGRRPLQRLCQRRQAGRWRSPISANASSSNRSRCGYGRRRRSFRA